MQRVPALSLLAGFGLPSPRRGMKLLQSWRQRIRTRRQLAALDERLLADVGIGQAERLEELDKPFWRG